jgi:hypothetical protein
MADLKSLYPLILGQERQRLDRTKHHQQGLAVQRCDQIAVWSLEFRRIQPP